MERSKTKQKLELKDEPIDRLSSLPDYILVDILSYLPLHSAVATSVLSHRWRYLWTQLTHLAFNAFDILGRRLLRISLESSWQWWDHYITTVNYLVPQFTTPKINSVCIRPPTVPPGLFTASNVQEHSSSLLDSWISFFTKRHVEQIEIDFETGIVGDDETSITIPSSLFQSQTLQVLSLSLWGSFRFEDGLVFSLPKLKKLEVSLESNYLLADLLKSCPLLEDLSLRLGYPLWVDLRNPLDLQALCLKRLYITIPKNNPPPPHGVLIFNVSKLVDVALYGLCLVSLRFENPLGALVTANMSFIKSSSNNPQPKNHPNTVKFAEMISSATSLHLNSTALKALSSLDRSLLPMFDNLFDLNIEFFDHVHGSWNDVLLLLSHSPNLQSLTLELDCDVKQVLRWVEPDNNDTPPCGFSKLKMIHVKRLKGNSDDYMMMKYIMSNAKVLELLSINVDVPATRRDIILWKEYEFCDRLFFLQTYSSTCKIELSGVFVNVS